MDRTKKSRLEKAGWAVGDASEFLGLTAAEEELMEMKLALSARLRKMDAGDPGVTMDLLVQGLLAAGVSRKEIAKALADPVRKKAS